MTISYPTPDTLLELRRLHEAVTLGAGWEEPNGGEIADPNDIRLAVRAVNALPALLSAAERLAQLEAELLKHQDLVESLQFLPAGTVVDFCDLDDWLHELRESGWRPRRECSHKFVDSDRCLRCGIDVDDLEPATKAGG